MGIIKKGDIYTSSISGVEVEVVNYEIPNIPYGDIGFVEYRWLGEYMGIGLETKTYGHFIDNFKIKDGLAKL